MTHRGPFQPLLFCDSIFCLPFLRSRSCADPVGVALVSSKLSGRSGPMAVHSFCLQVVSLWNDAFIEVTKGVRLCRPRLSLAPGAHPGFSFCADLW